MRNLITQELSMSSSSLNFLSMALRAFFKPFFWVLGFFLALALIVFFLSSDSSGTNTSDRMAKIKLLPNLEGKRERLEENSPLILQMKITGTIGTDDLNREVIGDLLQESTEGIFKEGRIKGLLLNIDSPGGSSIDSDGIYRLIKEYKEKHGVPVIAYVDGYCASGGFYIACAADEIYASDVSIVGSIGTIMPTQHNVAKLLTNYGIDSLTIQRGKGKDSLNPYRPWTEDDRQALEPLIDWCYNYFVDIVVASRPKLSKKILVEEHGAAVFPAPIALTHGYVDRVGMTHLAALNALAEKAGVDKSKVQVVELDRKHWIKDLFKNSPQSTFPILRFLFGGTSEEKLSREPLWLFLP